MRIDLNPSAMPELTRSSGSAAAAPAGQPAVTNPADASDDVASLSTGSASVQKLKAQLDAVPDVRQQLVEALRQTVAAGSYTASPQHIAQAMLEGESLTPGK